MDDRRPREREMVLAPNEFAYVLDTTKGQISCYVGPNKTSLAQTDQPVIFNEVTKRFEPGDLSEAIRVFATAPANWYLVLKNPAQQNQHPQQGTSNPLADLEVGRKITVAGPTSFPLWPGQMIRIIEGHRLKSNEFIYVRIYDVEEARRGWWAALARGGVDEGEQPEPPDFIAGEQRIIRGTEVSFYIPPTGVEVIPDEGGRYIRQAVTLQRLEYCILVGDDGRKRYVRGEAVVYPEPGEIFLTRGGQQKFKAIELSELTGVHLKVIAPWTDEVGVTWSEGAELFLTGKDKIYFPSEAHAIIRYGRHDVHHAIAIPRGEGRYVLNRLTGEISLKQGPLMYLPDPRHEVVVRRVLTERECALMYPGNAEVLAFNRGLKGGRSPTEQGTRKRRRGQEGAEGGRSKEAPGQGVISGDEFARSAAFTAPRTLTLDTRFDGAVTLEVWSGHCVQVVNRAGERRVELGPTTVVLGYDETVEALTLSTGTPKQSDERLHTAFLQVEGNKVSDRVGATTRDLVRVSLSLTYRVSFEGPPERWFAVADYVKLLSDHARSLIRAVARQTPIRQLRAEVSTLIRDRLLGPRPESGARPGLAFEENGMRVYDVEVGDLEVVDPEVAALLQTAQLDAIRQEVEITHKEGVLTARRRLEQVERALTEEAHGTALLRIDLEGARAARADAEAEATRARAEAARQATRQAELQDAQKAHEILQARLEARTAEAEAELTRRRQEQALALEDLTARVQAAVAQAEAVSPHLVSALNRLADTELLTGLSENFGELAAVEARGLLETARRFLDFAPASLIPALKPLEAPTHNGETVKERPA